MASSGATRSPAAPNIGSGPTRPSAGGKDRLSARTFRPAAGIYIVKVNACRPGSGQICQKPAASIEYIGKLLLAAEGLSNGLVGRHDRKGATNASIGLFSAHHPFLAHFPAVPAGGSWGAWPATQYAARHDQSLELRVAPAGVVAEPRGENAAFAVLLYPSHALAIIAAIHADQAAHTRVLVILDVHTSRRKSRSRAGQPLWGGFDRKCGPYTWRRRAR